MLNTTRIKITYKNGDVSIKPWCTAQENPGHLKEAKMTYDLLETVTKIELHIDPENDRRNYDKTLPPNI